MPLSVGDGRIHFSVGDRGQVEDAKDSLNGLSRAAPNRKRFCLADGPQATVNLHVALQYIVVVQILRIKVATAEQIVFPGH